MFHLGASALIVATLGVQRAIAATVLAVVFLCALVIGSVFDHLFTPALRALIRRNRLDHEEVLRVNWLVGLGCLFIPHQSKLHHYLNQLPLLEEIAYP